MQISYGLLTVYIILSFSAGAIIGSLIIACFSGAQVGSLQTQLNAKAEFFCRDCHYMTRNRELVETLATRESYVRTLEERVDGQRKQLNALGATLQKRTLGVA